MDENRIEGKELDPRLADALANLWDSLTDEQKEKAKACETPDELAALAGKEGIELSDEMLDAIAGGYITSGRVGKVYRYRVIRDDNGNSIGTFADAESARNFAKQSGWSTMYLNSSEVKKRYGC